ncbi:MAG: hemolysin, partial [Eubacterium sp.]|nr:hemolysin [Eubacterium sp.]
DIDDEFDEEDDVIDKIGEDVYLVDGSVSLDDLNEVTGSDLESETSETIGGFVIDQMGEIPEDGYINKNVDFGRYTFTVISVSGRRIERLKMTINKAGDADE